jgi:hypothetical protein
MLQQYDTLKDVIYGALIIAVIVLMPGGIYGALTRGAQSWPALRRSLASRSEGLPEEFPKELPQ